MCACHAAWSTTAGKADRPYRLEQADYNVKIQSVNSTCLSLRDFNRLFSNEEATRTWFEKARWPDGPVCPDGARVKSATWLSAVKMAEMLGVYYETSWHLGHPIPTMMAEQNPLLSDIALWTSA